MAATDVYDAANAILGECVIALNWTERNYVSNGPPAFECCPQLTVHSTGFNRELAGAPIGLGVTASPRIAAAERTRRGAMNAHSFAITLLECVPVAKMGKTTIQWPDPVDIDLASQKLMSEAWEVWNYLKSRLLDGTLFGDACRPVDLGPALPLTDQGGCGGWVIQIMVEIGGYTVPA